MKNHTGIRWGGSVKKQVFSVFVAAALIVSGFFVANLAQAVAPGVIINEFVSAPSSGNEWVELLNITGSPIDLTGWKLTELTDPDGIPTEILLLNLSGTIPANGILVFEVAGTNLNNLGDSIGLYDNTPTLINRVSYGNVASPYVADLTAPASEKSGAYISGAWQTDQTPTKGWFNDAGQEGAAPLLSDIDAALFAAGIGSNIGELDNPSATPVDEEDALYFEKSGAGKIVFTDSLNLSDQETVDVLQDLGGAMEMSDGHIAFDSETAQAMTDTGAKIYMYGLDFDSTPNIIVKDDEGTVIDLEDENYPDITDISYDTETGTLNFDASHFTQFDAEELPVTNETTGEKYATIQAAINDASEGDTISVATGVYVEVGQIIIDKDLTITGADKTTTIIKPNEDTGAGNHQDANAWILVNPDVTFNLSNVTLDGTGKLINHGILSHGHGTINNNIFTNIAYNQSGPDYKGIAIELYDSDMTVSSNSFSNIGRIGVFTGFGSTATITGNTYTGKGYGTFLDYGFEVGRNGQATISNNIVSNNNGVASDGSTSAGILITSYFDPENPSQATINNNTIQNNTDGIAVGYDGDGDGIAETELGSTDDSVVVAHQNKFTGNDKGINSAIASLDAINNYWGAASGPSSVGVGSGDAISSNVDYRPWLLEEDGTTYDQTLALTEADGWTLVSAPQLLSEAPAVVSDDEGSAALLVYEGGEFVSPSEFSEDLKKPVGAFYAKTENKGGVGFKYAESGPASTSKDLTVGWNLVGTNNAGTAQNEFSSIQNTGTDAGMVTLFVPDSYNSKKEAANSDFYTAWGEDANHDINANPITNLPENNLSIYDGYWIFMNAAKAFVKNL